ncbi:hypothetical protein [Sulfidibacter corallicola]|uniref:Uncharacterized protein n=1 Tax=Sulfidibacter corallicola TaxID=2818388 RepID=A0A8A4TZ91_SULCO|nr:hypothetical protein [Sulfidibacter corallicola]QTD54262.1 hypothetical protein J3U87_17595 [Sulfidibacter corallicola]
MKSHLSGGQLPYPLFAEHLSMMSIPFSIIKKTTVAEINALSRPQSAVLSLIRYGLSGTFILWILMCQACMEQLDPEPDSATNGCFKETRFWVIVSKECILISDGVEDLGVISKEDFAKYVVLWHDQLIAEAEKNQPGSPSFFENGKPRAAIRISDSVPPAEIEGIVSMVRSAGYHIKLFPPFSEGSGDRCNLPTASLLPEIADK